MSAIVLSPMEVLALVGGFSGGRPMNPSEQTRLDEALAKATCPACGESILRADLPVTIPDPEDDDDPESTPLETTMDVAGAIAVNEGASR